MKCYSAFIIIAVIIVTNNIDLIFPDSGSRSLEEVLAESINKCQLVTYTDKDFGFSVQYPSLFVPDTSCTGGTIGSARFCYNDITQIAIECYASVNKTADARDKGISALAETMHAEITNTENGYILYGSVYENGCKTDGYSHYTKCIAKDKLWFICSLVYPDEYAECLSRLFMIVNRWTPFWEGDRRR